MCPAAAVPPSITSDGGSGVYPSQVKRFFSVIYRVFYYFLIDANVFINFSWALKKGKKCQRTEVVKFVYRKQLKFFLKYQKLNFLQTQFGSCSRHRNPEEFPISSHASSKLNRLICIRFKETVCYLPLIMINHGLVAWTNVH